jgi:membrane protein required for colicin V production
MTWIDWTIVFVLAVSVISGLVQGFFRTAASLVGLILGLSVASWNYPRLAALLVKLVRIDEVADLIAFILIALLVMAVFNLLGVLLARAFRWMGLGCLDSLGGGVLGLFQGFLLVTLVILVTVAFFPQADWLAESRLPRQFFGALHWSADVTPSELAERLRKGLRLLEQDSPPWMHPGKGSS